LEAKDATKMVSVRGSAKEGSETARGSDAEEAQVSYSVTEPSSSSSSLTSNLLNSDQLLSTQ